MFFSRISWVPQLACITALFLQFRRHYTSLLRDRDDLHLKFEISNALIAPVLEGFTERWSNHLQ